MATLVVGDLNAHPHTLDIAVFRTLVPGLTDTWQQLRPDDPGYTSNSPDNAISAAGQQTQSDLASTRLPCCWCLPKGQAQHVGTVSRTAMFSSLRGDEDSD